MHNNDRNSSTSSKLASNTKASTHLNIPATASTRVQLQQPQHDAFKLYIDVPKDRILSLSSHLHLATAQSLVFKPPALHLV
ncbi:hypothetical protein P691DRAFT_769129 [Macrolepiota fuliginosa MF-IS2]|uniref:Uncharacterized protein n=1 Tax=Macrolepiota fuliginosa MF-IS2 TaxID=1400762 RepID=A0A9P6BUU2_9AGAR|nr:hypothetical protein P691DRAFT_769129 [Macrolepiota fuliginosa MF-IS2]